MTEPIDVARQAAMAGGEIIARYFHEGVEMRSKESYNLVSDADLESEQAIAASIRRVFPLHAVLGEETHQADLGAEHLWVVDPLDGTNNFAHRIPHFAVSIAYFHRGQPQCAVVYNPLRDDWYTAVRGRGAFHGTTPLRVARCDQLPQALIGVGFYYDRGANMRATLAAIEELFSHHIHGIRRMGTASLDLCAVAGGQYGAFLEYQLAPWDFAAGQLIVQEAGGRVTTCSGEPLTLEKSSLLASNGQLHARVQEITTRHFGHQPT